MIFIFVVAGLVFFIAIISYIISNASVLSKIINYKPVISSDGHIINPKDDITCTNLPGHDHRPIPGVSDKPRYIVHEEPEKGYVILNGVKRKLTDCKDL